MRFTVRRSGKGNLIHDARDDRYIGLSTSLTDAQTIADTLNERQQRSIEMPHDCKNVELGVGDEVILRCRVLAVTPSSENCNVSLQVIGDEQYLPQLTLKSKLCEREHEAQPVDDRGVAESERRHHGENDQGSQPDFDLVAKPLARR